MKCYTCFYRWNADECNTTCAHPKSEYKGYDVETHKDKVSECKLYNRGLGKDCKHRKDATRIWNKKPVYRCFYGDVMDYRCGANSLCTLRAGTGYLFSPKALT